MSISYIASRACWGNPLTSSQQDRVKVIHTYSGYASELVDTDNVQVKTKACKEPYTNLTPQSGVIVYPSDLEQLIRGRDLTGEVHVHV